MIISFLIGVLTGLAVALEVSLLLKTTKTEYDYIVRKAIQSCIENQN